MLNDYPWNESPERPLLETDGVILRTAISNKLADNIASARQLAVVELALFTGAKVNELAALDCGDVRLAKGHESIRISSRVHPRVLPLDDPMVAFLKWYFEKKEQAGEPTDPSAPLVMSQRKSRLSIRGWQEAWSVAQRLAELVNEDGRPLFNLEAARALAGRRVYQFCGNPHHVQAWLGMDESTNVDRYSPNLLLTDFRALRVLLENAGRIARVPPVESVELSIAVSYYNGTAGYVDRQLARRLFVNVPPEDVLGQFWIARCLHHGRSAFPNNPTLGQRKASRFIDEIIRHAKDSVPMAMFLYASALNDGLGVERNLEASARWYRDAAEAGFETALNNYGLVLEAGRGIPQDRELAIEIFERGATRHEASCMFNLAVMLQEGVVGESNLETALRWYKKAASIGDIRSMNNLSYLYYTGQGVPKDELIAERYYCLAGQLPYSRDGYVGAAGEVQMISLAG